jgi:hyperosmotically inducible protein
MKKMIYSVMAAASLALPLSVVIGTTGCAGDQYHRSTGEYVDDKSISTKVKSDLIGAKYIRSNEISVTTYDGRVQLSGFVDSADQKARAEEIARNVRGVQGIKNDLMIRGAAANANGAPVNEPSGSAK